MGGRVAKHAAARSYYVHLMVFCHWYANRQAFHDLDIALSSITSRYKAVPEYLLKPYGSGSHPAS